MNRSFLVLLLATWPFSSSDADARSSNAAHALFQQRCLSAGQRIHKTVKDVDGVFLLKLRPSAQNFGNQFRLDDPYGRDYVEDGYIESFLRAHHELHAEVARLKNRAHTPREQVGYEFVEAGSPKDGKRHRYTAFIDQPGKTVPQYVIDYLRVQLASSPASGAPPRYGVTYDDISTTEDRQHWIAGSSLRVLDLSTGEVIAERIGYMMDPGQGNNSAGRSPWLIAASHACPAFKSRHPAVFQGGQADRFVEKVLIPRPKPQPPAVK